MKNLLAMFAATVAAWSLLTGCESSDDDIKTLTAADNGQAVAINQGDKLEIQLAGNPTAGYTWEVSQVDASILEWYATDYVPDSDLTGSPGIFYVRFKGIASGTTRLALAYKRPFENRTASDFTCTVSVK